MSAWFRMSVRPAGGSVALLMVAGCGLGVAPTYPVQGRVAYKAAGDVAKLAGARIHFESEAEPKVTGGGEVQADGGFVAGCFLAGRDREGLPEGEYRVYLQPPAAEEDGRKRAAIVPARYRTFELTPLRMTVAAGVNAPSFEIDAGR